MLFSSLEFLFLFIVASLLIYFLVPLKVRNLVLLIFSLIFYGWGERIYIWLMVFTILIDYAAGLLVERAQKRNRPKAARGWLIAAIVINLALLGFFKYADFILNNLRLIPALSNLPTLGLELPIGISFYTFQALSYVIDVYRGDVAAQRSAVRFGTYVTLFPQLIAGPIVRYRDVAAELEHRTHSVSAAASGARTFVCGLAKKVLLANAAGAMWESFRAIPDGERTVVGAWLGIVFFTLQIYFDFSGYSDMAIGLGKMFGFRFLENFNYPLISRSATEFWRRWHMSLGTFFRDYVYIPLGGNRHDQQRNIMVVWFLTGMWHGASWNFILWGVYYGVLLMWEKKYFLGALERMPKPVSFVLSHAYTLFITVFGFAIFYFDKGLWKNLGYLFGIGVSGVTNIFTTSVVMENIILLAAALILSTPVFPALWNFLTEKCRIPYAAQRILKTVILIVLIGASTVRLVGNSHNPFLYFRF